jgi:hypothetical protein
MISRQNLVSVHLMIDLGKVSMVYIKYILENICCLKYIKILLLCAEGVHVYSSLNLS